MSSARDWEGFVAIVIATYAGSVKDTYTISTGCAVANLRNGGCRLLTARHGLLGKRGPAKAIEIAFEADRSDRHDVTLIWDSEADDLALLESPRRAPSIVRIAEAPHELRADFSSVGYARAAKREPDRRPPVALGGKVYPYDRSKKLLQVGVDHAPTSEEWHGVSGAPVLVDGALVGLIQSVPASFAGLRLDALDLFRVLKATPTLASLIELDEAPPRVDRDDTRIVHQLLQARDFQPRIEFEQLLDWWRQVGRPAYGGVCVLVGIGGSGKTALIERFLRILPIAIPVYARDEALPIDESLPSPAKLFVFSFYNVPNPDQFFGELGAWLRSVRYGHSTHVLSSEDVRRLLQTPSSRLIVLDGLERVQEDGSRGAFGRISDVRLRELLRDVSDGLFPGLRVLITTRFRLPVRRARHFRSIAVDRLAPEAAAQLLRARGVGGTDYELAHLASEHGNHALSVDLLGGLIAKYYDGDPARLPARPLPETRLGSSNDSEEDELREQERRFGRIASRYRDLLAANDTSALTVLEQICVFRLGVPEAFLIRSLLARHEDKNSLDEGLIRTKLELLGLMRLIEKDVVGLYTVHPAVRDGFRLGISSASAHANNRAAQEGLLASLTARPGTEAPTDLETLDHVEELIYHTIELGEMAEAWELFGSRLGGFDHLGVRLGAFERCRRILDKIAAGEAASPALPATARVTLESTRARCFASIGQLDAAVACHQRANAIRKQVGLETSSADHDVLTEIHLLAGRLRSALDSAENALWVAKRARDNTAHARSLGLLVYVQALRGKDSAALSAAYGQEKLNNDDPLWHYRKLPTIRHLVRRGEFVAASGVLARVDSIGTAAWGPQATPVQHLRLEQAEIDIARGSLEHVESKIDAVREWAARNDAKELLCWSGRLLAELHAARWYRLGAGRPSDADVTRVVNILKIEIDRARSCGFGFYHVDLRLLRSLLYVHEGLPLPAIADALVAVHIGVAPGEFGPSLPSAAVSSADDPETISAYSWGERDGRWLLGLALGAEIAGVTGVTSLTTVPSEWRGAAKVSLRELSLGHPPRQYRNVALPAVFEYVARVPRTKRKLPGFDGRELAAARQFIVGARSGWNPYRPRRQKKPNSVVIVPTAVEESPVAIVPTAVEDRTIVVVSTAVEERRPDVQAPGPRQGARWIIAVLLVGSAVLALHLLGLL